MRSDFSLNNINNNSTDVTAFLLLVVWFGPKCTLVDQKMSLLPGTKDITPGDPMADYVNALKAYGTEMPMINISCDFTMIPDPHK